MRKILCILITFFTIATNAQIERDKQLHFAAGGIASSFGYNYVYEKTGDKEKATFAGIGLAILAGTIKETIDSSQYGNKFDIEDLAATALGGITISVTINLIKNDRKNKKSGKKRLGIRLGKNRHR